MIFKAVDLAQETMDMPAGTETALAQVHALSHPG